MRVYKCVCVYVRTYFYIAEYVPLLSHFPFLLRSLSLFVYTGMVIASTALFFGLYNLIVLKPYIHFRSVVHYFWIVHVHLIYSCAIMHMPFDGESICASLYGFFCVLWINPFKCIKCTINQKKIGTKTTDKTPNISSKVVQYTHPIRMLFRP